MKHLNPKNFQFCLFLNTSPLPGKEPCLLSEVQDLFLFAYISQGQVVPERDCPGQTDATSS